jgi:peptidoglycan/LPS O-acetylase OafA/YrhL
VKYRADIDGLRAVAIISVVGFHAFPDFFSGGFTGVDIFFVISGYLITAIILGELEAGNFTLKGFYIRRIRRIFPALLLVLTSCLIFGWFALFADEYQQLGKHVFGGSTFLSNIIFWNESGYFDNAADKKPLLNLWSLAIEEQYYVIWPLLILFLWRKKINILFVTLTITLISFLLNIATIKGNASATFFLPHTRFWELLIGATLGYLTINVNINSKLVIFWDKSIAAITPKKSNDFRFYKIYREAPSIFGALLIIGSIFLIASNFQFPGWWAMLPVMGAGLMILSQEDAWINKVILSHPIMVWIGLISFPLYLWHWPILSFARILEGKELSLWILSLCIFLSIVLAAITYYCIERPIRYKGKKYLNIVLLVSICFIGTLGYGVYKEGGFSFRVQENEAYRKQFEWNDLYNSSAACKEKFPGDDYCNVSSLDTPPSVAIIGDSHANHFYWGLSEYYKVKDNVVINMGAGGCPPLIGTSMSGPNTSPNCYSRMKPIFDFILSSNNIDTVYIGFWHNAYFADNLKYVDMIGGIQAKDNYEYLLNALSRTIRMLRQNGKQVIFIYDLPDLKKDIKDCFLIRPFFPKKICSFDESIFVDDYSEYNRLIKDLILRDNLKIFDTRKYLKGNFPVDKYGVPTYRDYSHLSINGSLFFSDKY